MNKILSWKINSSTYAYIFPIKNSYISNRIPEDSPLWGDIITTISGWDEKDYWDNFEKMQTEVKSKCDVFIPKRNEYWDFSNNSTLPVNIVLLSGKDGESGGITNGNNNGGNESGDGDYDKELKDAIDAAIEKAKEEIEEQNENVKKFVEEKVTNTISEAKNTLAETKTELANTREHLETKLEGAADALDKAAALFDMAEGGITKEKLQEALSSVTECGKWIGDYSGTVFDFKTDYDAAKRILGGVGSAEDALAGLFSQIGTTINDMDNTVGSVERWMVASAGTIGDIATWYDVNASAVTEASSIINASAGTITDAINFISGDGLTTRIINDMNGPLGTIREEIMTATSGAVTNVTNELNGLSGTLNTAIVRLDNIDGSLTSMGEKWNSVKGEMETWINTSDSAMSLSHDLRDTWSVESGKLSTVANLTAETDDNGNIIYYVSGETFVKPKRVYLSEDGLWRDENGEIYEDKQVYVNWSTAIGSYIQQEADKITMSVMDGSGFTAAIKLAITREDGSDYEGSIISLISDRVVISGEMIANAISANTADIGGIIIGDGEIKSSTLINGKPSFKLDGENGKLSAINAELTGNITANTLTLGTSASGTIKGMIDQKFADSDFVTLGEEYGGQFKVSTGGLLTAKNAIISGTVYAQKGIIGQLSLADGILSSATFNLSSSGLVMQGSMRQQFMEYKSDTNTKNQEYYDNLYLSEKKSSGIITLPPLPCDAKQIGRRITLVNNDNGRRVNKMGTSKITLPNDYFFFEDGFASNSLTISNETVELLGYGLNASSKFFGWIVVRRIPMMSVPIYGHEMRVLASGRVKIATASKAELSRLYTCDKTTTIAGTWADTGNETKDYASKNFGYMFANAASYASPPECNIHFPKKWFSGCTDDDVFLQAIPLSKHNVWVSKETTSAVTVSCESGICSFDFILYNRKGWECLPERFNVELEISDTNLHFAYDSYGSSRKKSVTITKKPKNGDITISKKGGSGHGTDAFVTSWDEDTGIYSVYPRDEADSQPNSMAVTFKLTYFEDVRTVTLNVFQQAYDPCPSDYCLSDTL